MPQQSLSNYSKLVQQLKQEIRHAQLKASLNANVHLLLLYWKLGNTILEQQQKEGWGTKIIDRLSEDLRHTFPHMRGLSSRNLKYMRAFASEYPRFIMQSSGILDVIVQAPLAQLETGKNNSKTRGKKAKDNAIVQAPLAQLETGKNNSKTGGKKAKNNAIVQAPLAQLAGQKMTERKAIQKEIIENLIVQAPLAQLTWYHHIALIDKVKNMEERLFYIHKAVENNWSRNVLVHQIESKLWKRQGKAITNFKQTLPDIQGDLIRELLKDPYKFDFLSLSEEYKERDLENALIDNLTRFLLELGSGFSFVGRQYPIKVADKEFAIDLLFYHWKLRRFIAIELKVDEFLPEYIGKLNFYLNVIDEKLKQPADNATIGILICKHRNKVIAEYALRGINKPIGVSEYQLTEALPDNLKDSLPTIEQIANELKNCK